jgi:hypothetical protein
MLAALRQLHAEIGDVLARLEALAPVLATWRPAAGAAGRPVERGEAAAASLIPITRLARQIVALEPRHRMLCYWPGASREGPFYPV